MLKALLPNIPVIIASSLLPPCPISLKPAESLSEKVLSLKIINSGLGSRIEQLQYNARSLNVHVPSLECDPSWRYHRAGASPLASIAHAHDARCLLRSLVHC